MSSETSSTNKQNPVRAKRGLWQRIYRLFSSFGLAVIVLSLMLLLTLLGTLEQVEYGLYDTQKKYFDSLFVVHKFGPVPILLPGVYLLMVVLFINMTLGAIVRVKKRWKGVGMLISHFGMLFLLVSGFVTHHYSVSGNMALFEGEESNRFESYYDWQLEVLPLDEDGKAELAMVVPADQLKSLRPDQERRFTSAGLPFDLVVNGYERNALPLPVTAPMAADAVRDGALEVDGYVILPRKAEKTAERNLGAFYVTFEGAALGADTEVVEGAGDPQAILWAGAPDPFTLETEEGTYAVQLVRQKWDVPFTVRLDDFTMERHPGIATARKYESTVTKIEDGNEEKIEIKMNEPLRHEGYTFFQASWGPEDAGPTERLYSVFAVVKNPADQWPLYSLIITSIGLFVHFLISLVQFIVRAQRPRTPKKAPA